MIIVETSQWPGTRAQLEAGVAAYAAALVAHAGTVDQPAPVADPLVERIHREGGAFQLRAEVDPPLPETLAQAKLRRREELCRKLANAMVMTERTAAELLAAARAKRDAIQAAASVADVNAVDFNAGW